MLHWEREQAAEVIGNQKPSVKARGLCGCLQRHTYHLHGRTEKATHQVQDLIDRVVKRPATNKVKCPTEASQSRRGEGSEQETLGC